MMEKRLILKRVTNIASGLETAGVLMEASKFPFSVTLEPPWKNNEHDVSCVPAGTYILKPFWREYSDKQKEYYNMKGYWTWEVTNVPNRSYILLHSGSILEHTLGCILVAESFAQLNSRNAVLDNHGFKEFLSICDPTKEKEAQLSIMWV